MEFSEDVAPQPPLAATGVEESVAPEVEPELSSRSEQPEPGGEPQSTRQSGCYPLRRRVVPPDRYE